MKYDIKQKTKNLGDLNAQIFNKTLSMFEWENLPIPKRELEKQLQMNGYTFIFEHESNFYCSSGALCGELDEYNNPTQIHISIPYLKLNKTFDLSDGVLILNDDLKTGLTPILNHYNSLLIENEINLTLLGLASRSQLLLTAGDNKTKTQAELFLKRLIDGELSVIAENPVFDGVRALNLATNSNNFTSLIEYHQYLKGSLFHEIGLNANIVMKRERLTSGEVGANDELLYPFLYNMLENRLNACKDLQEKFNLTVSVDFGSIWKSKAIENVDNVVSHETPNEPPHEPTDEPPHEPTDEPPHEPTGQPQTEKTGEPTDEPTGEPKTAQSEKELILEMLKDGSLSDDEVEILKGMLNES